MRIQTLLNKVHPLKSFVYTACWIEKYKHRFILVAEIKPRKNGKILCYECGKACRSSEPVQQAFHLRIGALKLDAAGPYAAAADPSDAILKACGRILPYTSGFRPLLHRCNPGWPALVI
jgi:hypothetical protein